MGCLLDSYKLSCQPVPKLHILLILKSCKLVLGAYDGSCQLVKLLGGISLGICQGLLSYKVLRHKRLKGVGNLKIISEYLVVLYLKVFDTGLFPLSCFKVRKPCLSVGLGIFKNIYIVKISIFEYAALSYKNWRFLVD